MVYKSHPSCLQSNCTSTSIDLHMIRSIVAECYFECIGLGYAAFIRTKIGGFITKTLKMMHCLLFLLSSVEERPWWPIQSLNKGKKESERLRGERDQVKFIDLDLKDGKLQDSGKQEEGKTFHKFHVLGMNDELWDESSWKSMGVKHTQQPDVQLPNCSIHCACTAV